MATGTSSIASSPVFHGDDPEQITEYRSLSVLAIISLVIGIIAPIAIAGPFLLVVPFVGIAVSLLALRRIAVSGGLLAGRWAATVGLVLSIASAVMPVSHTLIQRAYHVNQAEEFGRKWVSLVTTGNLKQAFQLTIDANRSAPPSEPNAPPRPDPFETFRNQPIIKALEATGANADIRVRDTVDFQAATYRSITVRQLYAISPASATSAGANGQPIELLLTVQRGTLARDSMSRWMVVNYAAPKPGADSALNP